MIQNSKAKKKNTGIVLIKSRNKVVHITPHRTHTPAPLMARHKAARPRPSRTPGEVKG